MHRPEVNRFTCILQLIQHGLIEEAKELETFHLKAKSLNAMNINGVTSDTAIQSEDSEEDHDETLQRRRNDFVKRAIKNAGESKCFTDIAGGKIEALSEERRAVIKEFLAAAPMPKSCGNCQA